MPGEGVAIVGMACLFPGAPDLDAFRANLRAGVDAITDAPPDRWDPVFYDPESRDLDRFYGRRGGFVDAGATFDPLEHGVVPSTVDDAEPDQLVVLDLAVRALRDAGLKPTDLPQATTGVFLGRGGYVNAGLARSAQKVREGEQVLAVLRQVLPDLPEADLQRVKSAWKASTGDLAADAAIGLVPNLAASRTANRLDLRGPAFTFDAACASSLVAIDHAVHELQAGRLDAAIVGGVHLCHDPTFWSLFCRLGAMSRQGRLRAFDAEADGMVIGEGAGILVLLRESEAARRGLRPWAVIRGTGTSSDGRAATLMSPAREGQRLALARAWAMSGLDPDTVGLIEAHGTGTAAGDAAELATLAEFFGPGDDRPKACLGSVKSMIGHTMPAAGIAGVIKAVLAVHDGLHLPTLHVDTPHPALAATRFAVTGKAAPWPDAPWPRRAGVNAFGFGGVNAHVVLEQATTPRPVDGEAIALYAGADLDALLADLADDRRAVADAGPVRLALRDPTAARRAEAARIAARGAAWTGRKGVWFSPAPIGGQVALLFPGVEESFDPTLPALAAALGLGVPDALNAPPAGLDALGPRSAQILAAGRISHAALRAIGVQGDLLAGHSVGEWTALVAGGHIAEASLDGFVHSLEDQTLEVPDVAYAALGVDEARATALIDGAAGVVISHANAPHQTILCGPDAEIRAILAKAGALGMVLPFRSGFHTEHFRPFADRFAPHIARLPLGRPERTVWSSCAVAPWPTDAAGVRALLARQLVAPVRFADTVEALFAAGVRVFVQVGAGSLPGFVDDVLKGRPHAALTTSANNRSALDQLAWTAASLWALGLKVHPDRLPQVRGGRGRRLRLGAPLIHLKDPPRLSIAHADRAPSALPAGRVGAAARRSLDAIADARADVLAALTAGRPPASASPAVAARADMPPSLAAVRAWVQPTVAATSVTRSTVPRSTVPPSNAAAPTSVAATTAALPGRSWVQHLSLVTEPWLRDHAMFHQPPGHDDPQLAWPVVPMTGHVQRMVDAAQALAPGRVVIGLDGVVARRWLVVAPPVDVTVSARFDADDPDVVLVQVEGYAEARARLADRYPTPPTADPTPMRGAAPAPITVDRLYPDRWMFHGPAFQAVTALGPVGEDGIHGALTVPAAPGALLDNAGQIFGYWGFARLPVDALGFPARIERVRFFGPTPPVGAHLEVRARVTEVTRDSFAGDIELTRDGALWCRLEGWRNRRFETDDVLLPFVRLPAEYGLGERQDDGRVRVRERWRTSASRDLLLRRYLDAAGVATWTSLPPTAQRAWALRRIAIVDAAREHHWAEHREAIFPVELTLTPQTDDTVLVTSRRGAVSVRVAVHEGYADAWATPWSPP